MTRIVDFSEQAHMPWACEAQRAETKKAPKAIEEKKA
jgi:hypothetical protein